MGVITFVLPMRLVVLLIGAVNSCPSDYLHGVATSGCWLFDSALGKCNLANSACVSVSCSSAGIMSASLRPDVFGISNADLGRFQDGTEKLTLNDGSCSIGFDSISKRFQIDETVTNCGSLASNTNSNIEFASKVSRSRKIKFGVSPTLLVRPNIEVDLVCRYSNTVSVSSNDYNIETKPFIKLGIQLMTTIKVEDALLDVTSIEFKAVVEEIKNKVMDYWIAYYTDDPPFFVKVKLMTLNSYKKVGQHQVGRRSTNESPETASACDDGLVTVISFYFYVGEVEDIEALKLVLKEIAAKIREEENSFISECYTCGDSDCVDEEDDTQMYQGSVIGQGSLADGFDLTLHEDLLYGTPINYMPLGAIAYVKAFWAGSISGIKFYVDKCSYSCGTIAINTIDIIKDTCYAELLRTSLTTPNDAKMVSRTSTFSFKSFVFEDNDDSSKRLSCDIKICADSAPCTLPSACPVDQYLQYTMLGIRI